MKLLIKIFINDINSYDLEQIINALDDNISDKKNTFIHIMTNDEKVDLNFKVDFLNDYRVPIMINYKLSDLDWDLILPIVNPLLMKKNFDILIKNEFKKNFQNLDGVLELRPFDENNNLFVIGRDYYNRFKWIYNPTYRIKNYDKEFNEVLDILDRRKIINTINFKFLELKSEDDSIYELRNKNNFGL
jgi:hypothetical protein